MIDCRPHHRHGKIAVELDGVTTIEIGEVRTVGPTEGPAVRNRGTRSHAVLDFDLVQSGSASEPEELTVDELNRMWAAVRA